MCLPNDDALACICSSSESTPTFDTSRTDALLNFQVTVLVTCSNFFKPSTRRVLGFDVTFPNGPKPVTDTKNFRSGFSTTAAIIHTLYTNIAVFSNFLFSGGP